MTYRATILIAGAQSEKLYGRDLDKLRERAIKHLTAWEPGVAGLQPRAVVLSEWVQKISGNRSEWGAVETVPYNLVPPEKLVWLQRKTVREAREAEEKRNRVPAPPETKARVSETFTAELRALLARWGADIEAADHYPGYPECGEDVRMTATIKGSFDADGNVTREWTEIDLGRYLHS